MLKYFDMGVKVSQLVNGFSEANIERIYHGEPALAGGRLAEEAVTRREFETLSHMADGLSQEEASEVMGLGARTVTDYIHSGYRKLGIVAKPQLAGYFPLSPEDAVLEDKKLEDLRTLPAGLDILQALSVGWNYKKIAAHRNSAYSTVRAHMSLGIGSRWPDVRGALRSTMVANALRSRHVRTIESGASSVDMDTLGQPTLKKMAEVEPILP